MSTITGVIEDMLQEEKPTKSGPKTIHYIVVGGKKYAAGLYPANYGGKKNPASIGDEVVFESEFKYGENQLDYTTLQKTGASVARGAVVAAAPAVSGSGLRAHALAAASRVKHDLPDAESVIEIAKKFESYLLGE